MHNWSDLAHAVACRLEWERLCRRGALLDENSLVRAAAEYTQAVARDDIRPEFSHPDLPGRKVDLVGLDGNRRLRWALEAKWVCVTKGQRQWDKEVAVEVCRLQHLTSRMTTAAHRLLLVAGPKVELRSGLLDKRMNVGDGERRKILQELLPTKAEQNIKYQVRNCEKWLRTFFLSVAKEVGEKIPSTYDATLLCRFAAGAQASSIDCFLWLLKRPKGWGSFDPASVWAEA